MHAEAPKGTEKKYFCTSTNSQQLHLFLRKGLGIPLPCLSALTSESLRYGKTLHIVASVAVAILTRQRDISTCPQHIPAPTLNITYLSRLKSNPLSPAAKTCTISDDLFLQTL